jgi:hypothetical protein
MLEEDASLLNFNLERKSVVREMEAEGIRGRMFSNSKSGKYAYSHTTTRLLILHFDSGVVYTHYVH